jgi:LysR family hca operon transcriptional activator
MELRHLRYFLAVAEHLNFGRAAAALHTAQLALSQQIRKLEQELGSPLFERTKRYVALTALGQELFVEAQGIIETVDSLVVRMRDTSGVPSGRLRVGSIVPATVGVLPRILPSYRERFPLVDVSVTTVGLDEQVRALVQRRIDVGILRGPVRDARIHTAPTAVASTKAVNGRKINESKMLDRRFSIAPMMEWTDRAEKQSVIIT